MTDLDTQISVRVDADFRRRLQDSAKRNGRTEAQEIRWAIAQHLDASDPSGEAA